MDFLYALIITVGGYSSVSTSIQTVGTYEECVVAGKQWKNSLHTEYIKRSSFTCVQVRRK